MCRGWAVYRGYGTAKSLHAIFQKKIIFQVFARGLLRNNRDVPLCAIACSNVTSKSTDNDDFLIVLKLQVDMVRRRWRPRCMILWY
jgi:hypothetical protein